MVIGSKWGYTYTGDWRVDAETHEVKDHGLATFERQHAETAELLGDRLDLYQIHSVTADSPALSDKDLHARLAELAAGGTTVGFSTSGPGQADAIRAAARRDRGRRAPLPYRPGHLQRPGDLRRSRRSPRRTTRGSP